MTRFLYVGILNFIVAFGALALVEEGPIGFKLWKDSQFVEAKNKVARLSNQLTIIKRQISLDADEPVAASTDQMESADILPSVNQEAAHSENHSSDSSAQGIQNESKITQFQQQQIEQLEGELKRALENLQFVADLTIEDYFAVYLSKFSDNPDAIQKVAKDLTAQEVEQLLKLILKKNLDEATKIQTMRGPLDRRDASSTPL